MDHQLIIDCKRKSRNAQRQIYEAMAHQLNSVCKRYLKNQEDIEEVLTDTFYKIFTKIDQVNDPETFEAWARKITVNECLQKLRKKEQFHYSLDDENAAEISSVESPIFSLEKDILKLLNFLPEGCKTIFNLFAIEGYPHKEIAQMLSITEGTSKSQVNFARKKLQLMLHQQNF
ncbi:RNA polymerase sigma factor [Halpernia frigidisoli]|uniref:RNA polymerase sigma-70 factor, ECF subfamily n=1 Tax=Halpernia frigidisoli TaxID=1125876 RepID=A0A1I3DXA5_9FLAO|nr:sigma-70 family RNA polymerase sigma factor [Halpernia frigidisoli]SFH91384.1 RNA polymerase sigma-70 factor, ECF subfamily [Halpernia frigidisoli]